MFGRKKTVIMDKNLKFRQVERTALNVLKSFLRYLIATVSLAVFYYVIFALVVNTDSQKALRYENRLYQKTYADMLERERLISDAIDGIQLKDNQIYENIFHSSAPSVDLFKLDAYLSSAVDSIPDKDMVEYVYAKGLNVTASASKVEENFRRIMQLCSEGTEALPPMSLPLESISAAQVGASMGNKVNPFYKVESFHRGLDLIASQGDPVLAAADGVVTSVVRSGRGDGHVVEITHRGGYVTRYSHLGDIAVSKGQNVLRGKKIAEVGVSGSSFAPHLHYEVLKDGEALDPVNFLFASVRSKEYADFSYMASRTRQSLD